MVDGPRRDELLANSTSKSTRTKRLLRLGVLAVTWGASIYTLGEFLRAYWAPDACLDVDHGSFDYRNWQCSQVQHDYIDTALRDVPGFWLALVMLVIAIGATILTRHMANTESTHA